MSDICEEWCCLTKPRLLLLGTFHQFVHTISASAHFRKTKNIEKLSLCMKIQYQNEECYSVFYFGNIFHISAQVFRVTFFYLLLLVFVGMMLMNWQVKPTCSTALIQ